MIIGVVGPLGSGKDEVAAYLVSKGAKHISLSEEILKEIKRRKIPATRKAYVAVANDLREKISPGVLAERAFAKLKKIPNFVVDSRYEKANSRDSRFVFCSQSFSQICL